MMDESDDTVQSGESSNGAQIENGVWKKVRERLLLYFELLIALLTHAFVMSVIIITVGKSLEYSNQSSKFEESDPNTLITLNYTILLIASGIPTYRGFTVFYFLAREDARKRGNELVETLTESVKGILKTHEDTKQKENSQNDNN